MRPMLPRIIHIPLSGRDRKYCARQLFIKEITPVKLSIAIAAILMFATPSFAQGPRAQYGGQGPCAAEVAKFCSHVAADTQARNACLRNHRDQLSPACRASGQRTKGR